MNFKFLKNFARKHRVHCLHALFFLIFFSSTKMSGSSGLRPKLYVFLLAHTFQTVELLKVSFLLQKFVYESYF